MNLKTHRRHDTDLILWEKRYLEKIFTKPYVFTSLKIWHCQLCYYFGANKCHFIRHLLSKHSLDWVICKLCGKVSMGLIFTLGTGIFNTFMFRLFVSLKKSLCSCLIFTLVTWRFNTFMFRLLVSLKLVLSCCLIFTLVTWIFNTFMFGLLVSFNIAL